MVIVRHNLWDTITLVKWPDAFVVGAVTLFKSVCSKAHIYYFGLKFYNIVKQYGISDAASAVLRNFCFYNIASILVL